MHTIPLDNRIVNNMGGAFLVATGSAPNDSKPHYQITTPSSRARLRLSNGLHSRPRPRPVGVSVTPEMYTPRELRPGHRM